VPENKGIPPDVQEAFYRVVHDYGVQKLASRMGVSAGVLYNKANPTDSTHHKPTLADAVLATVLTGDKRILRAFASTVGEVCFPVPDLSTVSDASLIEMLARINMEGGDFFRAFHDGLAGGRRFDAKDYARIRKEGMEFIAAIAEGMERIRGMVDG